MTVGHRGLEQSVMTRIAIRSRELGLEANVLLSRFVTERFLYRLSRSPHASRFVLKGATLMPLWLGDTARPTRDADLAGFGDMSLEALATIFREVFELEVEPDGVVYDASSMRIAAIREGDQYDGQRMNVTARIGPSRVPLQIDVGVGDAISPAPTEVELPLVLEDFPPPRLKAYRPETSIAEKFHAIVTLAGANTRMKDFYDIDRLSAELSFDAAILRRAIAETFKRRGTELPQKTPAGLSDDFAASPDKQKQWKAFAGRVRTTDSDGFGDVVARVREFLMPVLDRTAGRWSAGGPWGDNAVSRKKRPG